MLCVCYHPPFKYTVYSTINRRAFYILPKIVCNTTHDYLAYICKIMFTYIYETDRGSCTLMYNRSDMIAENTTHEPLHYV